jgi:hypothetical protein
MNIANDIIRFQESKRGEHQLRQKRQLVKIKKSARYGKKIKNHRVVSNQ